MSDKTVVEIIKAMGAISDKAKAHPEVTADGMLICIQLENLGMLIAKTAETQEFYMSEAYQIWINRQ